MRRFLVVLLSLSLVFISVIPSFAQNQQINVPGVGWRPAQGDAAGTQFVTERYTNVVTSLSLANLQTVTIGSTFTTPAFTNPNGGKIYYRLLVTGSGVGTWRVKWRGSYNGIDPYPFINDDVVGINTAQEVITDTLQIVGATVNVSPGQWLPLRTRSGADVNFPFLQADLMMAAGGPSSAVFTLEIMNRR